MGQSQITNSVTIFSAKNLTGGVNRQYGTHKNLIKDSIQSAKGPIVYKWKLKDSRERDCGNDSGTMRHITDEYPNRYVELGINEMNEVTEETIFEWTIGSRT